MAEAGRLLSSPLPRARETAELLALGRPFETDPVFVEAPLPAPHIPWLRASPSFWWVLSRVTWWCGLAMGAESRPDAEARARTAAGRLAGAAEAGTVALCGHGWFNRMIGRVLRRQGWICVADGGDAYWSLRRYAKRPQS
ncbi:MAG: histidine phosphatase family protein [Alphaproteobacteria bacterium]|nr:histidine phosphatase family protein [Alphaproteobacteria bacterium]